MNKDILPEQSAPSPGGDDDTNMSNERIMAGSENTIPDSPIKILRSVSTEERDNRLVTELQLPNGSVFRASDYARWVNPDNNNLTGVNIKLYGTASIATGYGEKIFRDEIIVEQGTLTQGHLSGAGTPIEISTTSGSCVKLSEWVAFYRSGNIKSGHLHEDTTINGIIYPAKRKVLFADEEKNTFMMSEGRIINLTELSDTEKSLFEALENGDLSLVEENINELRGDGISLSGIRSITCEYPLNNALRNGFFEMADYLKEAGFDIDARDADGNTAMHIFTADDKAEAVQWLIDNKADFEIRNTAGNTPLIVAVMFCLEEIAELLLNAGADVNATGENGCTPLILATDDRWVNCEEYVVSPEIVSILIDNGADVASRDAGGCTPLINICRSSYPDLVRLIIEHGADVNESDANGNTPLICSVYADDVEVTEILISSGADVNASNKEGISVLQLARDNYRDDVAELLLENGAVE